MAIGVEIQDLPFKPAEQADKIEIQADGGGLGSSFYTTVDSIVDYFNNTGASGVQSVVAGTNVVVDATDPANPIVSVPDIGVETVGAGANITISGTATNPVINAANQLSNLVEGDSIEIDDTNPTLPVLNLSDTIKPGSGSLVTIYENGTGTLGIGNLSTGALQIGNGATASIAIRNLLWPTADGAAGEVLTTDGAGNLSFQPGGGGGTLDFQEDGVSVLSSATANFLTNFTVTDNAGVADIAHNPDANMAFNDDFGVTFGSEAFIQNNTVLGAFHVGGGAGFTYIDGSNVFLVADPGGSQLVVGPAGGGINASSSMNVSLSTTTSGGNMIINGAAATVQIRPSSAVGNTFFTESLGADDSIVWLGFDGTPMVTVDSAGILLDYARWPAADGTAGQTLTTDGSGSLSWESAGGAFLSLQGVVVLTNNIAVNYANNAATDVTWNTERIDNLNAWTSGTDITVPPGITHMKVVANHNFVANTTGYRSMEVAINGTTSSALPRLAVNNNPNNTISTTLSGSSGITAVTPGDIVTLRARQNSGGVLGGGGSGTWISIEWYA